MDSSNLLGVVAICIVFIALWVMGVKVWGMKEGTKSALRMILWAAFLMLVVELFGMVGILIVVIAMLIVAMVF